MADLYFGTIFAILGIERNTFMDWLYTSTREVLNNKDADFIKKVLGVSGNNAQAFDELFLDIETKNMLLDNKELYDAILQSKGYLDISPALYFYILVRRMLLECAIDNREVADYVSGMLTKAVHVEEAFKQDITEGKTYYYVTDCLKKIDQATPREEFYLRVQLADQSLFITGIFPDHLRHRTDRKAAPGLDYYEAIGSRQYEVAGKHCLAEEFQLNGVFSLLGHDFPAARKALNQFTEKLNNLGEQPFKNYEL